jgi:hypothetical protein
MFAPASEGRNASESDTNSRKGECRTSYGSLKTEEKTER